MIINALSACLLSHIVSNDIKYWACKQLVSSFEIGNLHLLCVSLQYLSVFFTETFFFFF